MTDFPRAEKLDPMAEAFAEAEAAAERGEVPVGAVLVHAITGEIVARAGNQVEADKDPSAHAEILVLRAGGAATGSARMPEYDLYVTLEPCAMCATAMSHARIRRLIFGAYDPKGGGVEHGARIFDRPTTHHRPEVVGGVREEAARALLQGFFEAKRARGSQ